MASPLLHVGRRFRSKFKTIEGREFYGQILEPPDTSRVSNFLSARRYLRTQPDTKIKARDVVIVTGQKYVVAEHGTGFYVTPIYKHFKMFEVDMIEQAWGARSVNHPVTGQPETIRDVDKGMVHISIQPAALVQDSTLIPQEMEIGVSNVDLQVEDKVGNFIVIKSDKVLGVTLLTLKAL